MWYGSNEWQRFLCSVLTNVISSKSYSGSDETSGCGHLSFPDSSYAGKWVTSSSCSSSSLVSRYLLLRLASEAAYVKVLLLISVKTDAVILKRSLLTMFILAAVVKESSHGWFDWQIWEGNISMRSATAWSGVLTSRTTRAGVPRIAAAVEQFSL